MMHIELLQERYNLSSSSLGFARMELESSNARSKARQTDRSAPSLAGADQAFSRFDNEGAIAGCGFEQATSREIDC